LVGTFKQELSPSFFISVKRLPSIIDAIENTKVFGSLPTFRDLTSWLAWLAWLKCVFCLPLSGPQLEIFKECTGRNRPPAKEPRENVLICGRRSGKSFIVSFCACYIGIFIDFRPLLAAGEKAVILILARDKSQAGIILSYIRGILNSIELLKCRIVSERSQDIELVNNVVIMVRASDFRSIRGHTVVACLMDETAFWETSPESATPDIEVLRAVKPAMSTIPNSKIFILSSPYSRQGLLYDLWKDNYGQDDSETFVWQAGSLRMNPTLPSDYIEAEIARDPEAAIAEWQGQFRTDVSNAFPIEAVEECTISGRIELPWSSEISYDSFIDPCGGRGDEYAMAISHIKGEIVVIDYMRSWPSPLDPGAVTEEVASILKKYRINSTVGDKYAGEWVVEAFRKSGIFYIPSERTKSEIYLEMVPLVCGRKVELLENKTLMTQFRRLQRRRGRNGRDVIDHLPGAHDDLCNAVCGSAVVSAQSFGSQPLIVLESAEKRAFVRELDSVFPRRRYGWLDEF
jgi:hypothetical protein